MVLVVIRRDAPAVASVERPFVATYFFRDAMKLLSHVKERLSSGDIGSGEKVGGKRGGVQTKQIINTQAYKLHIYSHLI